MKTASLDTPGIQINDNSLHLHLCASVCIHMVLKTPISHYCNTLQSPILQIAVYLYCRVHLALLHHLKGVGLRRNSMPQPGNPLAPDSFKTFWNHWKSMKTNENRWKSITINDNQCQSMTINDNQWKSMKITRLHDNQWKSIRINESTWKSIKIGENW